MADNTLPPDDQDEDGPDAQVIHLLHHRDDRPATVTPGKVGRHQHSGPRPNPTTVAAREQKVMSLVIAGATHQQVAELVGMKYDGVRTMVRRVLRRAAAEHSERVEEYRALLLGRAENLFRVAYGLALAGDLDAVRACDRLIRTMAGVAGVVGPPVVAIAVPAATAAEMAQRRTEFLDNLAEQQRRVVDGETVG